jgi:hypothetical protein
LSAATLLSGALGAAIVFVLTVVYGEVVRTRQRGRELTGLARVIRPEIKRNTEALQYLQRIGAQGTLTRADYQREHPIYDAWRDTRTKLAQLMPMQDFAVLANFYEELELLNHIAERAEREGWDDAAEAAVRIQVKAVEEGSMEAMWIVDGYCVARWTPLAGWGPGPIE